MPKPFATRSVGKGLGDREVAAIGTGEVVG